MMRRTSTWPREYARNRARLLATTDLCMLCGHPGATTADHIVPWRAWPRMENGKLRPGFNSMGNLQAAHGTMGSGPDRQHNRCPTCNRLCNQSKGAGTFRTGRRSPELPERFPEADNRPASRRWL